MMSSKPAGNKWSSFIGMELEVNSASCWSLLYRYITMHGPQNMKLNAEHVTVTSCILTGTPYIKNYLSSSMNAKLCRSHGYRAEPRLKLADSRMLKRVPSPKRKALKRGWIKLRYKEIHTFTKLYSDKPIKVGEMGGACGTYWEEGKSNHVFCSKT
jgi:hypothetical protein